MTLFSEVVQTNIVTLSLGDPAGPFCPAGALRDGVFSAHLIDTSAFTGDLVRIEFRQHTNVAGKGFFTLVDDVTVLEQPVGSCPNPNSGFELTDEDVPAASPLVDRNGDGYMCIKAVTGKGNTSNSDVVKDNNGPLPG